jgi:hypothetical protein
MRLIQICVNCAIKKDGNIRYLQVYTKISVCPTKDRLRNAFKNLKETSSELSVHCSVTWTLRIDTENISAIMLPLSYFLVT